MSPTTNTTDSTKRRRMGKPQRGGKKARPSDKTQTSTDGVLQIHHIRSSDVQLQGVVLTTTGMGEKHMVHPFFNRDDAENAKYLEDNMCFLKVFKRADATGETLMNEKGYARQALIFGADGESYSKEEVVESVRDIYLPAYANLETGYDLIIDDTSYVEHEYWTELLLPSEIKAFFKTTYVPNAKTFREFVTCDKERLYSVYKRGGMSRKEIKMLRLKPEHMVVEDAAKLQDINNVDSFAAATPEALALAQKEEKDRVDAAKAEKAAADKATAQKLAADKAAAAKAATEKAAADKDAADKATADKLAADKAAADKATAEKLAADNAIAAPAISKNVLEEKPSSESSATTPTTTTVPAPAVATADSTVPVQFPDSVPMKTMVTKTEPTEGVVPISIPMYVNGYAVDEGGNPVFDSNGAFIRDPTLVNSPPHIPRVNKNETETPPHSITVHTGTLISTTKADGDSDGTSIGGTAGSPTTIDG